MKREDYWEYEKDAQERDDSEKKLKNSKFSLFSNDSLKLLVEEARRHKLLSHEECIELFEKMHSSSDQNERERAREEIINHNLFLVIHFAAMLCAHSNNELADLVQEGSIGLMKAVEKYDHKRGYRFSTYASWWVKQAMERSIANTGRCIRLPVHVLEATHKITRARTLFQQKNSGREPTLAELARDTGFSVEEISRIEISYQQVVQLSVPIKEEKETELGEMLEDQNSIDPAKSYEGKKLKDDLIVEISSLLDERECQIICMRFGLCDDEITHTLEEIGESMSPKLTRERVRQILERALFKLRKNAKFCRLFADSLR